MSPKLQDLVNAEHGRAIAKYPNRMTLHLGVGLIQMKMFRLQQRACGHMTETDPNCKAEAQMCLLQIMATSARMLEEVFGVPTPEQYQEFNTPSS